MRRFGVVAAGTFPQKAKNKRIKQRTAPADDQRPQGQQHKRGDAHHFFDQHLPTRHRADIKRGRQMSASDARHHTPEQQAVRTIARACGARRGGILGLTEEDLLARDGHLYVHLCEKGGKEREAIVLPQYENAVKEIFIAYAQNPLAAVTGGKKRLFSRSALPKDMPLHYLRAQYAQDLYRYYEAQGAATGRLYHCRVDRKGQSFDKGVLMAVSQNLGHSRCDVVVSHYLYDKDDTT